MFAPTARQPRGAAPCDEDGFILVVNGAKMSKKTKNYQAKQRARKSTGIHSSGGAVEVSEAICERKRFHVLVNASAYGSFADAVKGLPSRALEAKNSVSTESSFDLCSSNSSREGLGLPEVAGGGSESAPPKAAASERSGSKAGLRLNGVACTDGSDFTASSRRKGAEIEMTSDALLTVLEVERDSELLSDPAPPRGSDTETSNDTGACGSRPKRRRGREKATGAKPSRSLPFATGPRGSLTTNPSPPLPPPEARGRTDTDTSKMAVSFPSLDEESSARNSDGLTSPASKELAFGDSSEDGHRTLPDALDGGDESDRSVTTGDAHFNTGSAAIESCAPGSLDGSKAYLSKSLRECRNVFARSRLSTIFLLIVATLCQITCGQQLCSNPFYPNPYNGVCYASCLQGYEICNANPSVCYSKCKDDDCTTKTSCNICSRPATSRPADPTSCIFKNDVVCSRCEGYFSYLDLYISQCTCRQDAISYTATTFTVASICPTGTDASCSLCPAGSYSIYGGGCTLCASGTYSLSLGSSNPNTCLRCSAGYVSSSGATSCTRCGNGNAGSYWTTDSSQTVCKCQALYSGADCNVEECASIANDISLLSLLVAADAALTQLSKDYDSSDSDKILNADIYVKNLFKVVLDANGDGLIRRPELIAALKARSMSSSAFANIPLWCDDVIGSAAKCYSEIPSPLNILFEYIDVDEAINRALQSHHTSLYHTFDGSGDPAIRSMVSSFPDPTWGEDAATPNVFGDYCQRQDFNYVSSPAIASSWTYNTIMSFPSKCPHPDYPVLIGNSCYRLCIPGSNRCPADPAICVPSSFACPPPCTTQSNNCRSCQGPDYYYTITIFDICGECFNSICGPTSCTCFPKPGPAIPYELSPSICMAGTDENCNPCPHGYFSVNGGGCTACPFGTYDQGTGAISSDCIPSTSTRTLHRTCGYSNGILNSLFNSNNALLQGSQSSFSQPFLRSESSYRQVLCIQSTYRFDHVVGAPSYVNGRITCSTGLVYDGTPIDLEPVLTQNGVVFSYLDTSSSETEFDIYVGGLNSKDSEKKLVVGINYAAEGCGRTSRHISFTDKVNSQAVGIVKEYGIKAIQTIKGKLASSSMTVSPYRIPFLVQVSGYVKTLAGTGVEGVSIDYCHLDPATSLQDSTASYCPLVTYQTDVFGFYSGEMRVSDPDWTNLVEYFNVTARLTETYEDGTTVVHAFIPPHQVASLSHAFGSGGVSFTDNTTVTIFGSVSHDPSSTAGFVCPFAGVPVVLQRETGEVERKSSEADGSFNFTVTKGEQVFVYIEPGFQGRTWISSYGQGAAAAAQTSRRLQASSAPSLRPTPRPTVAPSAGPTVAPSAGPTVAPSAGPTVAPSAGPTVAPSAGPTAAPTIVPSRAPTAGPTRKPTRRPTRKPSRKPTYAPTARPTVAPTPSTVPTRAPTAYYTYTGCFADTTSLYDKHTMTQFPYGVVSIDDCYKLLAASGINFHYFALQNGNECWHSNAYDTIVSLGDSTACTMPCATLGDICGGEDAFSLFTVAGYTTFTPTSTPSAPTSSPSVRPSALPSALPSSLPSTAAPTALPSTRPTASPSLTPTASPTASPTGTTFYELRAVFDFKDVPDNSLNPDTSDSLTGVHGELRNFRTPVKGGKVTFDFTVGQPVPYVHADFPSPGAPSAVSFEVWLSFAQTESNRLLWLIFGNSTFEVKYTLPASEADFYVAVTLNPRTFLQKIYVNGAIASSTTISFANYPSQGTLGFFIGGRDNSDTTIGMNAVLSQFKIWYGEIPSSVVYSTYLGGVDPSLVRLLRADTRSNVKIDFLTTSKQVVEIGVFGGLSTQFPMFGAETKLKFVPVDPQCKFTISSQLSPFTSSLKVRIAAMNYTVAVTESSVVPKFADATCSTPTLQCKCDVSKSAFKYLKDAGQLSQDLVVYNVSASTLLVTYTYRSGVCFSVRGSENLATTAGVPSTRVPGESCFPKKTVILDTAKTDVRLGLNVFLFERYPLLTRLGVVDWFNAPITYAGFDYNVPDSTVQIEDVVGGFASPQEFPYDTSVILSNTSIPTPIGLPYTVNASVPRPSFPFSQSFSVSVVRRGPDGVSRASNSWFIPVLGVISKEVPNVYPVASSPTLIFLVLRDPPGGGSFAAFDSGTTIEFGMGIDGMHTMDSSIALEVNIGAGADSETFFCAGFIASVCTKAADVKASFSLEASTKLTNSVTYGTSTEYVYSLNFQYGFSTSTDPNIAGHPSDVIVGGGTDLFVVEALKVALGNSTATETCLFAFDAYQWLPGKLTTYVLPVVEIETIRNKLQGVLGDLQQNIANPSVPAADKPKQSDIDKVNKEIKNWGTVLADYRSHNADQTPMFTAESLQYNDMANSFKKWQEQGISDGDWGDAYFGAGANVNPLAYTLFLPAAGVGFAIFKNAFTGMSQTCKGGLGLTEANDYVKSVCADFDAGAWQSLKSALSGACAMPGAPDAANSPLSKSTTIKSICSSAKDGTTGTTQDLLGFLRESDQLITFGANAPVSISYTSTVTDSIQSSSSFQRTDEYAANPKTTFQASVVGVQLTIDAQLPFDYVGTYSIGKTSSRSHSFERTVSITLDDPDADDYFAVKITQDEVFGTPVFTTMGGQSKCPGESGTSRRESAVRIVQIKHRCGADFKSLCDETTLRPGDTAYFGAVIENLSPTREPVDYTIQLVNRFSLFGNSTFQCTVPGQRDGLQVSFQEADLQGIPYNQWIEAPFSVSMASPMCTSFKDIEVQIIATCEMGGVYQYGIVNGNLNYAEENVRTGSSSSATFSVRWPSLSRRRLVSDEELLAPTAPFSSLLVQLFAAAVLALLVAILCALGLLLRKGSAAHADKADAKYSAGIL